MKNLITLILISTLFLTACESIKKEHLSLEQTRNIQDGLEFLKTQPQTKEVKRQTKYLQNKLNKSKNDSADNIKLETNQEYNRVQMQNEIMFLQWELQTSFVKKQIRYYKNKLNENE